MNIDYSGMAENLKSDLKKAIDKNKRTEEQANKTSELKKCPFCGGEAEFHRTPVKSNGGWCDSVVVRCKVCEARTNRVLYDAKKHPNGEEYDEALKARNARKPVKNVIGRLVEERRKEGDHMGNHCCGCGYDAFTDAIAIIKELM